MFSRRKEASHNFTYIYPIGNRQVEDSKLVLWTSLYLIWWWWWIENREVQVLCDIILFLCIFGGFWLPVTSQLVLHLTFSRGNSLLQQKLHLIPSNDKSPRRWVNFNSGLWYCEFCSNRILQYFPLSVRTTLTTWTTWTNGPRGQFGHPAPPRPLWPIKPLWQSWLIND